MCVGVGVYMYVCVFACMHVCLCACVFCCWPGHEDTGHLHSATLSGRVPHWFIYILKTCSVIAQTFVCMKHLFLCKCLKASDVYSLELYTCVIIHWYHAYYYYHILCCTISQTVALGPERAGTVRCCLPVTVCTCVTVDSTVIWHVEKSNFKPPKYICYKLLYVCICLYGGMHHSNEDSY